MFYYFYNFIHITLYTSPDFFYETYLIIMRHLAENDSKYISVISGVYIFGLIYIVQQLLIPEARNKYLYLDDIKEKTGGQTIILKQHRFVELFLKIDFIANLQRAYTWADIGLPFLLYMLMGMFVSGILLFLCITLGVGILISLIIAGLMYGTYISIIYILAIRNQEKLTDQLPFIIDTLSGALQAGYSLPQAFRFTAEEIDKPAQILFEIGMRELDYKLPIEDVFLNMQEKTINNDLIMVLDGIMLQYKMGGNMVSMLAKMNEWVRQKNKLLKDVKVFTSQGKMSGILVMLLWPASALIFNKISPEYFSVLFTTTIGKTALIISLLLELIGFAMIWKIIKIKI